jgi:hypothetical protein
MTAIDWLLDSDPSIRWQVMRDLLDVPADGVAAERARVATEGWGARLLALQGPDGYRAGERAFFRNTVDALHAHDPPRARAGSAEPGGAPGDRPRPQRRSTSPAK